MKPAGRFGHVFGSLLAGLVSVAALGIPAAGARASECADVATRGFVQVLTLNLLFSEAAQRQARFQAVADFLAGLDHPVDFLLLQEAVGGPLAGTDDSAEDLRRLLELATGEDYDLRRAFETGVPGFLATSNAILSRCDIRFHLSRFLPPTSETVVLDNLRLPVSRNIMMVRVDIPEVGLINLYNTHLCAGDCTVPELAEQAEAALRFVDGLELFFSFFRRRPHILGGDFNQDNFRGSGEAGTFGPELFIYDDIAIGEGFKDVYAEAATLPLEALCEDKDAPDEHCTVGVSRLDGDNARRIDYLFARGFGPPIDARVIFNSEVAEGIGPSVSDHAGVLARIRLPDPAVSRPAARR